MKEKLSKNTTCTSSNHLHIPSREDFHREFAGTLTISDFCTETPRNHTTIYYTHKELNAKKTYRENYYKKLSEFN